MNPLAPAHFDGRRFYNPGAEQARGLMDVLRWKLTTRPERSPGAIDDVQTSIPRTEVNNGELYVTLVNHSTVLLQQHQLNILTDPIWSERASPVAWAGPRRQRRPGVHLNDLPQIHMVLLSHNHYDHLDLPALLEIKRRWQPRFVVPLGVERFLRDQGFDGVQELDWGETAVLAGATIQSVPAQHFSARSAFDRNETLWCGYVIDRKIYFAGDTGFGTHFEAIRDILGPPRLALLPIGAYLPRWFMSPIHMSPVEALRAHQILGAQTSVAIHHGTFQLADDGIDTPKLELARCLKQSGIEGSAFRALANGECARID